LQFYVAESNQFYYGFILRLALSYFIHVVILVFNKRLISNLQ